MKDMLNRINKLMLSMMVAALLMTVISPTYVNAGSLDSLLEDRGDEVVTNQQSQPIEQEQSQATQETTGYNENRNPSSSNIPTTSNDFVGGLKEASDLSTPDTRANAVNSALRSAAGLIVQVLAVAITVFIVVRIMIDLVYIAIPMTRGTLSGGASVQGGTGPAIGSGFGGGLGSRFGGMSSGFGGMSSGYGGMSGGMGQQRQQGNGTTMVSTSAMMAVSSESGTGPDGKTKSPYITYLKAISKELIIVPVIIVLVATGTLQSLGYLIADVVVKLIGSIGNML